MRNQRFVSIFFFLTLWVMTTFCSAKENNNVPMQVDQINHQNLDTNRLFNDILNKADNSRQSSSFIDKIKKNPKKSLAATATTGVTVGLVKSLKKEEEPVDNKQSNNSKNNSILIKPKDKSSNNSSNNKENFKPRQTIDFAPDTFNEKPTSAAPAPFLSQNSLIISSESLSNPPLASKENLTTASQENSSKSNHNDLPKNISSKPSENSKSKEHSPKASPTNLNQETKNSKGLKGQKIHLPNQSSLIIEEEAVNNEKAKQTLINLLIRIPNLYQWYQIDENKMILENILSYEDNFNNLQAVYKNNNFKKFLNYTNVLNEVKSYFINLGPILNFTQIFQQIGPQESLKIYSAPDVIEIDPMNIIEKLPRQIAIPPVQNSPSVNIFDQSSINFNPKDIVVLNEVDNSIPPVYLDANGSAIFSPNPNSKKKYKRMEKK